VSSTLQTVLIVGAGPVGLTAAVFLRQLGIPCRIIDKNPTRTNQSRAAIIHARTLEHLESLGVLGHFLAKGVKVHGVTIFTTHGQRLARFTLDHLPTQFPYFLGLNQSETERLLTEELSRLNLEIQRPCELVSLEPGPDQVKTVLQRADGHQETASFGYVLGCDGARSTVRNLLGLKLEGETLEDQWLTADIKVDWEHARDEAVAYLSPDGFLFMAPMDKDRWRAVINTPGVKWSRDHEPTLEHLQEICNQRLGMKARLYDPIWISPFAVNTRMVTQLRVGRAFLLGDAAHVHSPVGGQGMNTGIQDAINLAWKLGMVIKGDARDILLDSYHEERHANARRLLALVGPATRMVNLHNPLSITGRNFLLKLGSLMGVGSVVSRRMSELDIHYAKSPIVAESVQPVGEWITSLVKGEPHPGLLDCWDFGAGPKAGERAPDTAVFHFGRDHRLFELWLGDHRFQLLVFAGLHARESRLAELLALVERWNVCLDRILTARLIQPGGGNQTLVLGDPEGQAHHTYGARHEALYLIRPDGYIGFRCQPVNDEALENHLAQYLNL